MHSARLKSKAGNWIASLNIYRRIIENSPEFTPAYCELARLYLERDDLDGARRMVKKVLSAYPENAEAHFVLGVIEYIEGNFEAALRSYRVVERKEGLDSNLAMNIALVCEVLGLQQEAIKNLEYAIARGEPNAKVYEVLADLYRSVGELAKAIRTLENGVVKFPREASLHYYLGRVYALSKSFTTALTSLETATRLSPKYIPALEDLAGLYVKLERMEDAARVLTKLVDAAPNNKDNWLRLAEAYMDLGHFEKSAEILKEARQLFPSDASINRELKFVKTKQRVSKDGEDWFHYEK